MKTIAVIQARLGSTRLPNKVLLPLAGKSMVHNVFERVSRAKKIDYAVIAWPTDYDCDENDLVKRLLLCAQQHRAYRIIRVCSDCPCVEPREIDAVANYSPLKGKYMPVTVLSTAEDTKRNHDGFGGELYTVQQLEWMDKTIKDALYREHPHKFWIALRSYQYVGKKYSKGFRLDVNTQENYEKLRDIYDHFGHNHFTVKEVIEYLEQKNLAERNISP